MFAVRGGRLVRNRISAPDLLDVRRVVRSLTFSDGGDGNQSPGGSVSNHTLSHRAFSTLVAATIATLLGCASGKSKDTMAAHPDYSRGDSVAMANEGKSLEDLFAGKFPGVTVLRAEGGGLQILIRGGNNSFYGSSEPLYIVDDTPLGPGSRGIVFLAPQDIQKIEVLKNPADVAIYGVRGGNGVIKITTRRPGR